MKVNPEHKAGFVVVIDWPRGAQIGYKGFDGKEIWPNAESYSISLKHGLASFEQLGKILHYQQSLQKSRLLYLQLLDFDTILLPSNVIKERFSFSGYDYGNYISEYNYYSLVCHEIVLGSREGLKSYAKYLNQNLLLNSLDIIPALEKTKTEMRVKGEHLEEEFEDEEFQPVAIYYYNE